MMGKMKKRYLIALASIMAGVSFAQVSMPAQTVSASPVQGQMRPPTSTVTTPTQPSTSIPPNPGQTAMPSATQPQRPAQPVQPLLPPPSQPLTPQEMQQLNQLVPPMTGTTYNLPSASGLSGSIMSKRERVKNYTVIQRVGNIYIVSSKDKHAYVLRSDSQILHRYKCHIEYPYVYCKKKHRILHKSKYGLY